MAAHRYWRVYVTAAVSGGYVTCVELELRKAGGTNVATGGAASASSTGFGWSASNAFDGNASGGSVGWHSGTNALPTTPEWLAYDLGLGNDEEIVSIAYTSRTTQPSSAPKDFALEYSDDGASWTAAWSYSGITSWTGGDTKVFADPTAPIECAVSTSQAQRTTTTPTHRYWRIAVTAADGQSDVRINDLELRESPGGADTTGSATITANNNYFGHVPSYAVDGSPHTDWSISAGASNWLKCDFGAATNGWPAITEVAITTGLLPTYAPKDFTVQWSDDDSTWTTAMTLTGVTDWQFGQRRTFNSSGETATPLAAVVAARYWRMAVLEVDGGTHPEIANVELRESIGGADATGSGTAFSGITIFYGSPDNAFDASASTVWSPQASGGVVAEDWFVGYDFGSGAGKAIAEVAVQTHPSDATLSPTDFLIQRSDDKLAWDTVGVFDGQTGWSAGETRAYTLTHAASSQTQSAAATAAIAVSLVGSVVGATNHDAGTTVTLDLTALAGGSNSSPQQGDMVVVIAGVEAVSTDRAVGVTAPSSGYTELAELFANDVFAANLSVSYKFMGATPDASVTVGTTADSADLVSGMAVVLRGVDSAGAINVQTATGINGGSADAPSISGVAGAVLGAVFATGPRAFSGSIPTTINLPSDGNDYGRVLRFQHPSNNPACFIGATLYLDREGSVDPAAWSGATSSNAAWAAVTLSVEPLAAHDVAAGASTSQAQSADGAGTVSADATGSTSQSQSADAVAEASLDVQVSGSQAQSTDGSVAIELPASTSQAQTAAGAAGLADTLSGGASQAQSSAASVGTGASANGATSQAQGADATAATADSLAGDTSQRQSASGQAEASDAVAVATSQAQSADAVAGLAWDAQVATSQGQTSAAEAGISQDASVSTAQVQGASAAGTAVADASGDTAQGQTAAAVVLVGGAAASATSQAQSALASGTITGTAQISTSQGQSATVVAVVSLTAIATSSQGQTSAATASTGIAAQASTSQGQRTGGELELQYDGANATSQGQTSAGTAATAIAANGTTSQGQAAAAVAATAIDAESDTSQVQRADGELRNEVAGIAATEQAQGAVGALGSGDGLAGSTRQTQSAAGVASTAVDCSVGTSQAQSQQWGAILVGGDCAGATSQAGNTCAGVLVQFIPQAGTLSCYRRLVPAVHGHPDARLAVIGPRSRLRAGVRGQIEAREAVAGVLPVIRPAVRGHTDTRPQ